MTKKGPSFPKTSRRKYLVLTTDEQRESLLDSVRKELLKILDKGQEGFDISKITDEEVSEKGTRVTRSSEIKTPIQRYWMTASEIMKKLETGDSSIVISLYTCYYHLHKLREQGLIEQHPPYSPEKKRVRGMFFRAAAEHYVQSEAEQKIRDSKERLDLAIVGADYGIWDMNLQSGKLIFNKLLRDVLGYAEGLEPSYDKFLKLIHPQDLQDFLDAQKQAVDSDGRKFSTELRVRTKERDWIWFLLSGSVVERNENGEPIRAAGVARDITDQKTAKAAKDISEKKYRKLVEESLQGIVIFQDEKIVFANPAYTRILGRSVEELLALSKKETWALNHPDDIKIIKKHSKNIKDHTGTLPALEFRYVRPDGEVRWAEAHSSSIEYNGKPATQSLEVDITERKKAEKTLIESEQRNRIIANTMSDLVLVHDAEGRYIEYFAQDESLLIRPWDEIKGKRTEEVVPQDIAAIYHEYANKVRKTGESVSYEYELEIDGNLVWFQDTMMLHEDGESIVVAVKNITERSLLEHNLRESEQKYRTLVENIPEVFWTSDSKGHTLYISPNIEKIYGYSPMEIYESGEGLWFGRIHPEDVDRVKRKYARVFQEHTGFEIEYRIQRKDGEWIWLNDKSQGFYESGGEVVASGVFSDITKRKLMEEALTESEGRFRNIIEHTRDIFYSLDENGNVIYSSPQSKEILGYTPEEMLGPWTQYLTYSPVSKAGIEISEHMFSTGQRQDSYELEVFHKDGSRRLVEITASPQKNEDGNVIGTVGVVTDISVRKLAEQELRMSEKSLRNAQRIAHLGNWEWEILPNTLTWSDEIYRIFGLTPQEFEATHEAFMERVHPDDREHVQELIDQVLHNEADYSIDHRIVLPDGTVRIVHEEGELTLSKDGSPERLIGTIQDITELKIINEKLEETLDSAEFFVDLMSHDLSNMNQAIYGLLDILLYDDSLELTQTETLQEILYQISRSSRFIKDVKTFKMIGDNPPELIPVDPIDALTSAVNLVEKDYRDKTLKIVGKLNTKQFQVIANDLLIDAFYALLHNAMRFDKSQEVVVEFNIRETKDGSGIVIEISDHGSGIPDVSKELLFERISQKRKGHLGRGIGLTLLKHIMDHYDGTVSVKDRVKGKYSRGAKFELLLPGRKI